MPSSKPPVDTADASSISGTSSNGQIIPTVMCNRNPEEAPKLEDVYEELGGFSWFQLWATLILILPEIPAAMIITAPIFTGSSKVEFTCVSDADRLNRSANYTLYSGMDPEICSVNCSRRAHNTPYRSIVQEFDLVCGRDWISDSCHSFQMVGMMVGSLVASLLSDRFGRKKSSCTMVLIMAIFGISAGLAPDVYSYALALFFSGVGVGGFYVSCHIYVIEFLIPSWRTICGCISLWFFGELLLALLAFLIPSWRILTIVAAVPALVTFVASLLIPDSPRWLLCKGRITEGTQALNQIAKCNGKPPPSSHTIRKLMESICSEDKQGGSASFIDGVAMVLKNQKLRIKFFLFSYCWFAVAIVYYGITFNLKNLGGDEYLNLVYLGLVDFAAYPFGAAFNNRLGRRKTFAGFMAIAAFSLVGLVIMTYFFGLGSYPALITTLLLIGKFGIAAGWGVVVCFATESFPTTVRSTCVGFCSFIGNVGGALAPLLAYAGIISPVFPYYIFCGFTVLAAALSWFLGETNKKVLQNFVV